MSYSCYLHGWYNHERPCSICRPLETWTSSGTGAVIPQENAVKAIEIVCSECKSEIRELKNQINGLQFELKVSHSVAVENKELREKLEYTENKLGTMLAIDEMLYLRGFSKPTDWSVSNARWKVIVKLQSLAREALSRIRDGDK